MLVSIDILTTTNLDKQTEANILQYGRKVRKKKEHLNSSCGFGYCRYLEFPVTGGGVVVSLEERAGVVSKGEQMIWWLTLSLYYVSHLKIRHNLKSQWESRLKA